MRHILVLTAGYGEGHNSAARNVAEALNRTPGTAAEVHDPFLVYGARYERSRRSYLKTVAHAPFLWKWTYRALDRIPLERLVIPTLSAAIARIAELLRDTDAETVVCTYPIHVRLARRAAELVGKKITIVAIVTDSISINRVWTTPEADALLTADRYSAAVLRHKGVSAEKIRTTGFPVPLLMATEEPPGRAPPFTEAAPHAKILLMANAAPESAPALAVALARLPRTRLTVIAGNDAALHRAIRAALTDAHLEAEVLGRSDRLPALIREHHVILGKAGGATTHEALAARTPFVITRVLPGQEEGNARLIERLGAGGIATSTHAAVTTVSRMLHDDAAGWRRHVDAIATQTRRDGARRTADAVLAA